MKQYLAQLLSALLGVLWRNDAYFYFKGLGYANKFALEKATEITYKDWLEIVKKFV